MFVILVVTLLSNFYCIEVVWLPRHSLRQSTVHAQEAESHDLDFQDTGVINATPGYSL